MDQADLGIFERSLRHATESCTAKALDAALESLGWTDAHAADDRIAVSTLFELQGAANVTSGALGHVVASALEPHDTTRATGVVLPALGHWRPPAVREADHVAVHGFGTADLSDRETALVVARNGDEDIAVVVSLGDLTCSTVGGIDPWLGLVDVTGEAAATEIGPVDWRAAVALGHLALGHELVGASRKMLELARQHALERIQFGRSIAMFQAIRHRLADTLVAIEAADALLAAAWDDRAPETAAMAKALAGRGARTAARHCQQVLAGIGFTTEHPLHRYVRRVLVLDELLGSARVLTKELGDELLSSRHLPALLPL